MQKEQEEEQSIVTTKATSINDNNCKLQLCNRQKAKERTKHDIEKKFLEY